MHVCIYILESITERDFNFIAIFPNATSGHLICLSDKFLRIFLFWYDGDDGGGGGGKSSMKPFKCSLFMRPSFLPLPALPSYMLAYLSPLLYTFAQERRSNERPEPTLMTHWHGIDPPAWPACLPTAQRSQTNENLMPGHQTTQPMSCRVYSWKK